MRIALLLLLGLSAARAEPRTGVFPFYPYARRYQIWEYRPLDQGSRLVQLEVIGSERDADIVRAVRRPHFFEAWGDPISWDGLEKTAIEKCVWLNRWDILPSFAREYYLTGDTSYLRDLLGFLRKWREENPPPDPSADLNSATAIWRDMQVSWRVENLAWCYFLGGDGFTPAEKDELYAILRTQARVLFAYFGPRPLTEQNHQAHAGRALLTAALLFPDLPQAAALRDRGRQILAHHLAQAFTPDGNTVELVPGYYPFFASIYRDSYLLCRANGVPPPPRIRERLAQFYDYLATVEQPDGRMPPINDSSESLAPVSIRILGDLLGLPFPHPAVGSHWFYASDQAVMRDPSAEAPAYVFLDAGGRVGGHWHGGKLGFHLWYWDRPFVVDSGESDYDEPLRLSWYATPAAHNTLLVDGIGDHPGGHSDPGMAGAGSRISHWESTPRYDWAVMTHAGFLRRSPPVRWTRHFLLLKGIGAIVVDRLESAGAHGYSWRFHLLPSPARLSAGDDSVFTGLSEKNLLLRPADSRLFTRAEIDRGLVNQEGRDIADPVARYDARGSGMIQSYLLLPVAGGAAPDLAFAQHLTGRTIELRLSGPFGKKSIAIAESGPAGHSSFLLQLK